MYTLPLKQYGETTVRVIAKDISEGGGGIYFSLEGGGEWVDEVVQFAPHGGTEELLVSEHCLADCPRCLPVFFCFTVHCLPVSRSVVEAGDKCGAGPPRCKWPFSQPRRLLLSATHSHLVPLLFSSTNHFILAGSPPSVLCWQAPFDSNVMQAERFKPVSLVSSFLMNYVQKGCHRFCNLIVCTTGGSCK